LTEKRRRPIRKIEANPEELKSVVEHEEVLEDEAAVIPLRALKNQHEDLHLAVRLPQSAEEKP
jgi:hypothetical protein